MNVDGCKMSLLPCCCVRAGDSGVQYCRGSFLGGPRVPQVARSSIRSASAGGCCYKMYIFA